MSFSCYQRLTRAQQRIYDESERIGALELCHHLDCRKSRLADSFHAEGFYRHESGLVRQLYPEELQVAKPIKAKSSRLRPPSTKV